MFLQITKGFSLNHSLIHLQSVKQFQHHPLKWQAGKNFVCLNKSNVQIYKNVVFQVYL